MTDLKKSSVPQKTSKQAYYNHFVRQFQLNVILSLLVLLHNRFFTCLLIHQKSNLHSKLQYVIDIAIITLESVHRVVVFVNNALVSFKNSACKKRDKLNLTKQLHNSVSMLIQLIINRLTIQFENFSFDPLNIKFSVLVGVQ